MDDKLTEMGKISAYLQGLSVLSQDETKRIAKRVVEVATLKDAYDLIQELLNPFMKRQQIVEHDAQFALFLVKEKLGFSVEEIQKVNAEFEQQVQAVNQKRQEQILEVLKQKGDIDEKDLAKIMNGGN